MSRAFAIAGGLLFLGSQLYFGFSYAWRFGGPTPAWSPAAAWSATLANIAMFSAFALHHSLLARSGARAWISRAVPAGLERSVYVWVASTLFLLVCLFWQPVPGVVWRATGVGAIALLLLQGAGVVLTVAAASRRDVLELSGVRQALTLGAARPVRLDRGPFGLVRHPIYLGWFMMVAFPPLMNGTRLVFATISCAYLLLAIPLEERDLVRTFGEPYVAYTRRVKWRVIPGVY